jgi:hypothetical protein
MSGFGIVAWVAVVYESCILGLFTMLIRAIVKRYLEKKNTTTRLLMAIFILYGLGIMFSLITVIINAVWGGIPYTILPESEIWLVGRLHDGRFGFVVIILASVLSYELKVKIIDDGKYNKVYRILLYAFSALNVVFQVGFYGFNTVTGKSVTLFQVLSVLLMVIQTCLVYFKITINFFALSRRVERQYKNPIRYLGVVHLGFILVFLFFALDGLMLILYAWAYSTFYWFIWMCAVVSIIACYYGYIKPSNT